jgi:two-component system response regulator PilR (NtrC family)
MESEFFGHRKGSFTGAVSDKQGLFQSAEGGTLFLDEIADLPLTMQVKLLRVIQEKTMRPIGQTDEIQVDVRILSATHKDLDQLVAQGEFRKDLFYRVNVIELNVPPLRDRGDDVFVLSKHTLERLATAMQMAVPSLDAKARDILGAYEFPGNVRELENVLERAVTLCDGATITAGDIQVKAGGSTAATPEPDAALGDKLENIERDEITQALEQSRYNKTATAKRLGLSLRALRYRIKKLGIE